MVNSTSDIKLFTENAG